MLFQIHRNSPAIIRIPVRGGQYIALFEAFCVIANMLMGKFEDVEEDRYIVDKGRKGIQVHLVVTRNIIRII